MRGPGKIQSHMRESLSHQHILLANAVAIWPRQSLDGRDALAEKNRSACQWYTFEFIIGSVLRVEIISVLEWSILLWNAFYLNVNEVSENCVRTLLAWPAIHLCIRCHYRLKRFPHYFPACVVEQSLSSKAETSMALALINSVLEKLGATKLD